MANLLGQNIVTNYKGILNLNTLNGNLSATLQAVTDGDGNASPLQLSTQKAVITGASSQVALTIIGAAGANVQEWFDSSGNKIGYLNNTGGGRLHLDANNYISAGGEWVCNVNFVFNGRINNSNSGFVDIASLVVNSAMKFNGLTSSRPATVGQLYQDTAANILANGDKVVGIRV